MPVSPRFKSIQIKPLTGGLDTRSMPEDVPYGWWRFAQNAHVSAKNKLCRATGYRKLGHDQSPFNNRDLHDQLFTYERQPITSLFSAVSPVGFSTLFVGTQNRLYAGNAGAGNFRVISDNLGGESTTLCAPRQWKGAQHGEIVVLTNQLDKPCYHVLGQPLEASGQGVAEVRSLVQTLKVTRVQVLCAWKGFIFAANVVSEGQRVSDRIHWCDFQKPLSWKPGENSLAGKHDLGYNETILAMLPLGDTLQIYTTNGIWEAVFVGGDTVFGFRQKYSEPRGSNACLAFHNTVISTGSEHLYFGRDGIYSNSPYSNVPVRVEWMHRASSLIFDDIEKQGCSLPCGGYDPVRKLAWWSWARDGETCNTQTIRYNTEYPFADYLPEGFSAFCNHQPDTPKTIRNWIIENCICTADQLESSGEGFADNKEGGYCSGSAPTAPACGSPPDSIYTTEGADLGDGTMYEDFTKTASAGSLYTLLGDMTFDELCTAEQSSDDCDADQKFVMASAADLCLKESSTEFYALEVCTNIAGCGTYASVGYDTILRMGPLDFRSPDQVKTIRNLLIEVAAALQETPSNIEFRIGCSRQAADPNTDDCSLVWHTQPVRKLACAGTKTGAQHKADNTAPATQIEWPLFRDGRFLFFEFKVSGVGGSFCASSLTMEVAAQQQY